MNPHQLGKSSLKEMVCSALRNRELILGLIRQEILTRYRGSILGVVWSFMIPLTMLTLYTVFFSVVLQTRWGGEEQTGKMDFAIILYVGLIIHGLFSECFNRAPLLISSHANFVKKIIFPLEILPWVALGTALFQACIGFVLLILAQWLINGFIPWTIVFMPLVILPFLIMLLGVLWMVSSMGVFVRDFSHLTGPVTTIVLFISPVFYSLTMLPEKLRILAFLNPLTLIITESRNIFIFGVIPNFLLLTAYTLLSILVAWLGFTLFQKIRQGFADVL